MRESASELSPFLAQIQGRFYFSAEFRAESGKAARAKELSPFVTAETSVDNVRVAHIGPKLRLSTLKQWEGSTKADQKTAGLAQVRDAAKLLGHYADAEQIGIIALP